MLTCFVTGFTGDTGATGLTGASGFTGNTGFTGATGARSGCLAFLSEAMSRVNLCRVPIHRYILNSRMCLMKVFLCAQDPPASLELPASLALLGSPGQRASLETQAPLALQASLAALEAQASPAPQVKAAFCSQHI